jgi:hypothetical protein
MTDLLFIELGAVVTGFPAPAQCTIEPFCDPNVPPTYYDPTKWYTVDFNQFLDNVQNDTALYDQIVLPVAGHRMSIGPNFPGGGYEGILCVRYNFALNDGILGPAAGALDGSPRKYQVITSIAQGVPIQRYHGFLAQYNNGSNTLTIGKHTIPYESNPKKFYTGNQVDGTIIPPLPVQSGPASVFINLDAFSVLGDELPKLPPSAGL